MSEARTEDEGIEPIPTELAPPPAGPPGRIAVWAPRGPHHRLFRLGFHHTANRRVHARVLSWSALGIGIAQPTLIATWAALAPGNLVVRLPWALTLVAAMWCALVLGSRPGVVREDAALLGVLLLAGNVFAQVPLWIAKAAGRWNLVSVGSGTPRSRLGPWQFNLRHLLVATFLVAVVLSIACSVLPLLPVKHNCYFGMAVIVSVLLSALLLPCSLLVTFPCIWGAVRSKGTTIPLALGWLLLCGVVTGGEIAILSAFLGPDTFGPGQTLAQHVALLFPPQRLPRRHGLRGVARLPSARLPPGAGQACDSHCMSPFLTAVMSVKSPTAALQPPASINPPERAEGRR